MKRFVLIITHLVGKVYLSISIQGFENFSRNMFEQWVFCFEYNLHIILEKGIQFLLSDSSLSFFSVHMATVCFSETLNSPILKALSALKRSFVFRSSQNVS